jgi:hypothetical protein
VSNSTTDPSADPELRHGYTLDHLTRLAHYAARHKLWEYTTNLTTRYELAFSAMAEQLYSSDEPPAPPELIHTGWRAIRQHHDSRRQFLGLVEAGPDGPSRGFERYWRHVTAPAESPEDRLIERLALAQIWPHLRPIHREGLAALAAHGDYDRAAESLGLTYRAFTSRISGARREFLALWHDGEKPSRIWVRDRRAGPGTDQHTVTYFLRARRLRAAAAAEARQPNPPRQGREDHDEDRGVQAAPGRADGH